MSRIVRRRVLIREKDYNEKLLPQAIGYNLYDRVEWEPLSRKSMEQENIMATLKNQDPLWDINKGWTYMFEYHNKVGAKIPFYNPRYTIWTVWPEGDEMWIQPTNHNGKPSRLGIAVLEKDTGN